MYRYISVLIFVLIMAVLSVRADVIKPCPETSPRCQIPAYVLPNFRVIVIWWSDGFYCRVRGSEAPFSYCLPFRVNGVILGWYFYIKR